MRVAGYARLSRDEDKESYSSILAQRRIIEECARQYGWTIDCYFEDDNCSGYTFDRPGMRELIRALESDLIDVVIAKDLSRIGRHNAYTLLFIDQIKTLGKRLILPMEGRGYDSMKDEGDLLGITTWYNEMYVKDISRKIKGSIKAKQKEGRMIIKNVFGYEISKADKHKLVIDAEAALIVEKIFKLYLSGIGYRKIAELLNQEGYPTPSKYKLYKSKNGSQNCRITDTWNALQVQRILKNDIYTGTLRLGKTEKKYIKGRSISQPLENQFIFKNNHPAIITMEQFEAAQQIAQSRRKNHSKGAASLNHIFSGLIYCRDCGSSMIAYERKGKSKSYICGSYHRFGKKACTRHTVSENLLKQAIMEYIIAAAPVMLKEAEGIKLDLRDNETIRNEQLLGRLKSEREQTKAQLKQLIMRRITELSRESKCSFDMLMQESFEELEKELKHKLQYLDSEIYELSRVINQPQEEPKHRLYEFLKEPKIEKPYLEVLIDKILIDSRGTPTIYMKADFLTLCVHNREAVNLVLDQ
jgi:site-specific DNA recombinase